MICKGFFYLQLYFLFSKKKSMEVKPSKPDSNESYEKFVDCKTYLVDGKLKNGLVNQVMFFPTSIHETRMEK